jgi:hypothetical protein
MKYLFIVLAFGCLLSCTDDKNKVVSQNELIEYFYPYDSIPKIYCYRDVSNGINEKFHRVYGIEDSKGKHIVVEYFSEDGRILEAYNYLVDSLRIYEHMVVNRDGVKITAQVKKNALYPMNMKENTWFASKFPGFQDSTLILAEVLRGVKSSKPQKIQIMGKKEEALVMQDTIRWTQFNPFTRNESELIGLANTYFAKGIGLVRMHDQQSKSDYVLEKILSQKEWVDIMNR